MDYKKEIELIKERTDDVEKRVQSNTETLHIQAKTLRNLSYAALGSAITIILFGLSLLKIVLQLL